MENIVPFTEFDIKNINVAKLRTLDNGGKVVSLFYKLASGDQRMLTLQTPELSCPYGLSKWDNDGKGPAKYTLDLSFKGYDSRETVKKFYKGLTEFDSMLIENGLTRSEEYFKRKYSSRDVVEALYTSVVRRSKDEKYPPTFKMTIPYDPATGEFRCKVFDKHTKEQLNISDINLKSAKVTAIVQCTGVWIAGGKFGSSWKAVQLRVEQTPKIAEYAFRDIEGDVAEDVVDEDDNASDIMKDPAIPNTLTKHDDELVESSDDELETKPSTKKTATRGGRR
jgi:hypothetical protein